MCSGQPAVTYAPWLKIHTTTEDNFIQKSLSAAVYPATTACRQGVSSGNEIVRAHWGRDQAYFAWKAYIPLLSSSQSPLEEHKNKLK
jgi:hypothetical protein